MRTCKGTPSMTGSLIFQEKLKMEFLLQLCFKILANNSKDVYGHRGHIWEFQLTVLCEGPG